MDNPGRIVALVPMRHDSERVRGKNYRLFAGRPLYHHVIEALLGSPLVDEVVIDTDSPFIHDDARKVFPNVTLLQRPEYLRSGTVSMNDVLLNTVRQVEARFYLQTHSTNPLLTPELITGAITSFLESYPACDSLFSVTPIRARLWDAAVRAINHDPAVLLRTQDLPPVYEENSCLYIFTRENLETWHNRIGEIPLLFEMDREDAIDIDNELDFRVAEFLFAARSKRRGDCL